MNFISSFEKLLSTFIINFKSEKKFNLKKKREGRYVISEYYANCKSYYYFLKKIYLVSLFFQWHIENLFSICAKELRRSILPEAECSLQ